MADLAMEELGKGLRKMEGVVRKVLPEGIDEGMPEMSGIDRRSPESA